MPAQHEGVRAFSAETPWRAKVEARRRTRVVAREGEKYLREAVKWEKQWHSKSFENPPEVVKMLEGRNLLGGVAV